MYGSCLIVNLIVNSCCAGQPAGSLRRLARSIRHSFYHGLSKNGFMRYWYEQITYVHRTDCLLTSANPNCSSSDQSPCCMSPWHSHHCCSHISSSSPIRSNFLGSLKKKGIIIGIYLSTIQTCFCSHSHSSSQFKTLKWLLNCLTAQPEDNEEPAKLNSDVGLRALWSNYLFSKVVSS
jgi:hypothetical protein